ncbi:MAG: hypothetical protein KJZ65_03275 [Phycisphaerales bacterium]|nr:hypothetical protein [Phycisphaerales bacterium]
MSAVATLASLVLGPIQFDRPMWLMLIPGLGLLTWWIGRRSLAGLDSKVRWVAFFARLLVIGLISAALAEPATRRTSRDVSVTIVQDLSRSIPRVLDERTDAYIAQARAASKKPDDLLGLVTAGVSAYVQMLPSRNAQGLERQFVGATDGTNLAEAVRLALGVMPQDAANRIVLISDGNETIGSLRSAAEHARAVGVPIDVVPVELKYDAEVIVERVSLPATVRGGEVVNVKVVITATRPTAGRLMLTQNGDPIDLDPSSDSMGYEVVLDAGKNVLSIPVPPSRPGAQEFEAEFVPIGVVNEQGFVTAAPADSVVENNRAQGVTFVGREGWVLVVAEEFEEAESFRRMLTESDIRHEVITADLMPNSLTDLNSYEAIILLNEPAYHFNERQQENLRQYVHDTGGGLLMVGGPESFGAGGWIGSPLEDALPIRLDPPQKRQMPRGALVLVIHSVEMPNGVYWGKQVCNAAVDALSSLDLAGIIEVNWSQGVDWVHPLIPLGDRVAIKQAINKLTFGDMQDFGPSLNLALNGLQNADAGQKHCIVISDGDPTLSRSILQQFVASGVSISAVGVFPHSTRDFNTLKDMAEFTGGTFYPVNSQAALTTLPEIFIKEAQTVKRSLIWEGEPFSPAIVAAPVESMRGITGVPPITGYVVAADRGGLSMVTLRGQEEDPVAAQWQYGLGRVYTFTSDASSRWAASWVAWQQFKAFWEQQVRWTMRPGGDANMRVSTRQDGDDTIVEIEALDAQGERINFANFQARVARPDGSGQDVQIRQVGPGLFQGTIKTEIAGSYVLNMAYKSPGAEGQPPIEGTVQAAVTRPFADEFRNLTDNLPLLRDVASLTGGRVLQWNPGADDLWRRDGLTMPVATRSIWLWLATVAVGVFLLDVGVRRVRIDLRAVALGLVHAVRRGPETKAGQQMDSLHAAREKARQRLAQQASAEERKRAARKFEAGGAPPSAEPVTRSGPPQPSEGKARILTGKPTPKPGEADDEEGMSRLLKAKRRAQDEYKDDDR